MSASLNGSGQSLRPSPPAAAACPHTAEGQLFPEPRGSKDGRKHLEQSTISQVLMKLRQ